MTIFANSIYILISIKDSFQQNYCHSNIMSSVKQLHPEAVEKFVRSRVNHSYNKQVFEQELNDQIHKNLTRMQANILKDMKRKMIVKNQSEIQLEKREKLKKELDEKLKQSEQKREKRKEERLKQMSSQKKFKQQLFNERREEIKKKELEVAEQRLKQMSQKKKIGGPDYNKITRAVSLIEQPHYKRKLDIQQAQYNRLRSIVEEKSAFKDTKLKRKQLSLSQISPRQSIYSTIQSKRINEMGEHLQKIDQSRKKRQQLLHEKIKNIQSVQKYVAEQKNQRLKIIMEAQKQRQENIMSKLSKSAMPSSKIFKKTESPQKQRKVQPQQVDKLLKGSIIYEQSQDREKHTYRKQIKQQIRQYMIKQKQKLLNK